MAREKHALKLGKRAAFDKSRLKRLRQEDDTWEAGDFLTPQPLARTVVDEVLRVCT